MPSQFIINFENHLLVGLALISISYMDSRSNVSRVNRLGTDFISTWCSHGPVALISVPGGYTYIKY